METTYAILVLLTIYPYLAYPLIAMLMSKVCARRWTRGDSLPGVSLIVSACNEENIIAEKLANSLSLDYPEELLEVIIASDGSTDRTNRIVRSCGDSRVVLLEFSRRSGKTACLNHAVEMARGDVLVFTDANAMFPPETLRKIVRNFSDRQIGLVTGWTKYRSTSGDEGAIGLYARLERSTKQWESLVSSCVGADGALFAMRKSLYRSLKAHDINDFVIPLNVVAQHRRVVLDPEVFCIEPPSGDEGREFRRQVRITSRTLGAIWRNTALMNPLAHGSFSLFLMSHKLVRLLTPFAFLAALFLGLALADRSPLYTLGAMAQVIFIAIGLGAICRTACGRVGRLCACLLLAFSAQTVGWLKWAAGKSDVMWLPER